MRLLLDTHTFIWWHSDSESLSSRALNACEDTDNELLLSVASLWEMQIKLQLGRLKLRVPLRVMISSEEARNRLMILPIRTQHVLELDALPRLHNDPFDRILVAQARYEKATLVSGDPAVAGYPVATLW
jgi:PIN domain nuclease of toxin-antitoxin system